MLSRRLGSGRGTTVRDAFGVWMRNREKWGRKYEHRAELTIKKKKKVKYMKITHQSKKVCVAIFQTCAVSLVVLMRHGCCNMNIFYNFNISKK